MSSTNEPSKVNGQYNSLKGTVVETIGSLSGSQDWVNSGKETHAKGEAEYNAAQAKGYVDGTSDRLQGKYDSVAGAVTGDKAQQTAGNARHDKGVAQQEINKPSTSS